ncbi:MAG: methyltransferase domain-containing protein [Flavobacterium sp.]|nr:methyltransferase domain-containing protein [Flavobacterium sp.]
MFKKILSYFVPINILKQKSAISKSIEVSWNNGQLVMDTENTNYSYGSLQRILRKGLLQVGFDKIKKFNKILILGVAGGSVIKTLVNELNFEGKIVGVEIDQYIIEIANQYFKLDKIDNLELILDNAENFVTKPYYHYNLIVIDIFQDNFMPEFLFKEYFIESCIGVLEKNGFIIFNTMILNKNDKIRNLNYISLFDEKEFKITKISNLEQFNELIIIEQIGSSF